MDDLPMIIALEIVFVLSKYFSQASIRYGHFDCIVNNFRIISHYLYIVSIASW